jgi:hypothetical protein
MSRPAKRAGLWLQPEKRNPNGTLRERAAWVIRDEPGKISTGCPPEDCAGAERALGERRADKYKPNRARGRHPSEILIADDLCLHHLRTGRHDAPSGVDHRPRDNPFLLLGSACGFEVSRYMWGVITRRAARQFRAAAPTDPLQTGSGGPGIRRWSNDHRKLIDGDTPICVFSLPLPRVHSYARNLYRRAPQWAERGLKGHD